MRLIYEAYFIFGEFSDDRKLISSALVLLLTVTQSHSRQSWNYFNIPLVSAHCWYSFLYDNSRAVRKDQTKILFIFILTFVSLCFLYFFSSLHGVSFKLCNLDNILAKAFTLICINLFSLVYQLTVYYCSLWKGLLRLVYPSLCDNLS